MARGRHEKKIDTVHWTYGSFDAAALAAGTVGVNVLAAQHLPETLLRIRGEVYASLDGNQSGGQGVALGMGLIQVPEGTGTTVLWSPITDGDAPWIWWDTFHLFYEEYVTDVIIGQAVPDARRVNDSKAMRKLRNTEIQFVAENATISNAASVRLAGAARFLAGS